VRFIKKQHFEKKKTEKNAFLSKTAGWIQHGDQNIDGVDCLSLRLQSPIPVPGSIFHSLTLGSFDLWYLMRMIM